jgi:hypothetical protein
MSVAAKAIPGLGVLSLKSTILALEGAFSAGMVNAILALHPALLVDSGSWPGIQ